MASLNGLADAYRGQRKYVQAEGLYTSVLALRRRLLGDNHPDTVATIDGLVKLYEDWRKPERAAEWARTRQAAKQVLK